MRRQRRAGGQRQTNRPARVCDATLAVYQTHVRLDKPKPAKEGNATHAQNPSLDKRQAEQVKVLIKIKTKKARF